MFAMAKFMEMETTEQNKAALYLFNSSILPVNKIRFAKLCKTCYNSNV